MDAAQIWRRCSSCKEAIACGATYWTCNVSTCNRKRTALYFCSVSCWDAHLPVARHRDAWAEEQIAPMQPASGEAPAKTTATPRTVASDGASKRRRIVRPDAPKRDAVPREVLVIASRLKEYVRARSGYNTSDRVLEALSEIVRAACDDAIENASREGRKTILDRDVPDPK